MLFREMSVYFENHKKHINTVRYQDREIAHVKFCDTQLKVCCKGLKMGISQNIRVHTRKNPIKGQESR
jgi:hypothetical protein